MLDRIVKEKLFNLGNELLNKDYRVENINITVDDEFVYIELLLKIGSEYVNNVIRIKDMTSSPVYDNESIYSNIRSRILHTIEYEYNKQLIFTLKD